MKKIMSFFVALLMIFTLMPTHITAKNEEAVTVEKTSLDEAFVMNVKHVMKKDNVELSDGSYYVKPSSLIGTALVGKEVIVKEDGVYINNVKSEDGIEIDVNGILVGIFVGGVIHYVTGYSGDVLASKAIAAIVALAAAHPVGFFLTMSLLAFTAAVVYSYKTTSGNECVLNPSGHGYTCKYSL